MTTVPKAIADRLAAALQNVVNADDSGDLHRDPLDIESDLAEIRAALRAYESQQAVEAVTVEDYRQAVEAARETYFAHHHYCGWIHDRAAELAAARAGKEKGNG